MSILIGVAGLRKSKDGTLEGGSTVGPYRIEARVGEGGMGLVYRAVREGSGETVALKVLRNQFRADEQYTRRFRHEARAAREVEHRHLVPLLDFGEVDGRHYIAMRYVPGRSLHQRIREDGPLPVGEVVGVALQVGSALNALHAHGLVHRDVKPGNILLDLAGNAYVTDFGLAKGRGFSALTKPGAVLGTLDYLAPERFRRESANALTDIYAFGCVVYEALAGTAPFAGRSVFEVGMAVLEQDPPDPCAGRKDAPRGLSRAVLLALAKDPTARPPTAMAYANLLSAAARSG